jgi:hypothetical protein
MNPSLPGTPGASVEETTPYCPRTSICGKKGRTALRWNEVSMGAVTAAMSIT